MSPSTKPALAIPCWGLGPPLRRLTVGMAKRLVAASSNATITMAHRDCGTKCACPKVPKVRHARLKIVVLIKQVWLLFTAHKELWFADGMNIGLRWLLFIKFTRRGGGVAPIATRLGAVPDGVRVHAIFHHRWFGLEVIGRGG